MGNRIKGPKILTRHARGRGFNPSPLAIPLLKGTWEGILVRQKIEHVTGAGSWRGRRGDGGKNVEVKIKTLKNVQTWQKF